MESWWADLDHEVLECLTTRPMTPAEIGDKVGLSEGSVTSMLAMLAQEGRIQILAYSSTK